MPNLRFPALGLVLLTACASPRAPDALPLASSTGPSSTLAPGAPPAETAPSLPATPPSAASAPVPPPPADPGAASGTAVRREAPNEERDRRAHAARDAALREAMKSAELGVPSGTYWGREVPEGQSTDLVLGDALGSGGLGLSGVGTDKRERTGIGAFRPPSRELEPSDASGAPSPQVGRTLVSVTGALPRPVVDRVIAQRHGDVVACYESTLELDPKLAGRVSLRVVVDADGVVTSAEPTGSTLPESGEPLLDCLVSAASDWTFPAAPGRRAVTIVERFTFATAAPSRRRGAAPRR